MIARVSRSWLDTCNPTKPKTKKITSTTTTAQASSQGVSVGSAAALSHHHRLWNSTYLAMKYRAWCWVGAFNDMVNNVITLFLENGRVLWKQFCQSIHSHQVLLFSWFGLACWHFFLVIKEKYFEISSNSHQENTCTCTRELWDPSLNAKICPIEWVYLTNQICWYWYCHSLILITWSSKITIAELLQEADM